MSKLNTLNLIIQTNKKNPISNHEVPKICSVAKKTREQYVV